MRKPAHRLILVISLFELLLPGGISAGQRAPPNATVAASPVTLEARVAYQQAIERIYWQHRLWPKENPKPKPALEEYSALTRAAF